MAKQAISRTKASTPRKRPTYVIAPAPEPMMTVPALPTHEAIAQRAFELYQARGEVGGDEMSDWLRAETELRGAQL
jgi:hypothetical protein